MRLQRAAFSYLIDICKSARTASSPIPPATGSPCSIAVVGFALSCYPIGVKNGWMSRADAVDPHARRAAVLLAKRAERAAGRDRLQRLLLPLPRHEDRQARVAMRALAGRYRVADGWRPHRRLLFRRRWRREGNPRAGRRALPPRRLALGAEWHRDGVTRMEAGMRFPALRLGRLQRGDDPLRARAWLADISADANPGTRAGVSPINGRT